MVEVFLQPYVDGDLPLLEKLLGDPAMMAHIGGPESQEQIHKRHERYLQLSETDHMFTIVWGPKKEHVGNIGYWQKNWRDQLVYEMGWFVLPEYQGHGIATQAGQAVLEHAHSQHRYQFMHAFPSVTNAASNAICRKLGFTLIEACDFEYPPGNLLRCNDWRFDLHKL